MLRPRVSTSAGQSSVVVVVDGGAAGGDRSVAVAAAAGAGVVGNGIAMPFAFDAQAENWDFDMQERQLGMD